MSHEVRTGHVLSQKALPRRTFLRGRARRSRCRCSTRWSPAFAADRAPWTPRLGFIYTGNGIVHKTYKLQGHRQGLRVLAGVEAARAAARLPHRDQRPRSRAGQQFRRRHRRSSALVGRLAHGRARVRPHAPRRRGQARDDCRSARGRRARRAYAACARSSSPSTRPRRAPATPATASTSTPFRGATRRRRTSPRTTRASCSSGCSATAADAAERARAHAQDGEHPRLGARRGESARGDRRPQRPQQARRVLGFRARDRAAHRRGGGEAARRRASAGAPARHSGFVRRLREAHARLAAARVPDGHDARLQHDHRARSQQPPLRAHRRAGSTSRRLAPPQRRRPHREEDEDRRVPRRRCSATWPRACARHQTATARCSIRACSSTAAAWATATCISTWTYPACCSASSAAP